MMISVFDKVENIVRKKKILVTSIFFFPHNVFKGLLLFGSLTHLVIILDQEKGQGGMKKGQGGRSALSIY